MKTAVLVLLLASATPVLADDCAPAARGYVSATSAVNEAMPLVERATKGWSAIKVDDANRAAYDTANTALGAYSAAVDAYLAAVTAAEPHIANCTAKGDIAAADIATLTEAANKALAVLDSGQAYLKAYTEVEPSAAAPAPATTPAAQ